MRDDRHGQSPPGTTRRSNRPAPTGTAAGKAGTMMAEPTGIYRRASAIKGSAEDVASMQIAMNCWALTLPPVCRSTSLASLTLGFRSPRSGRVIVLAEHPILAARR
ncbi:hypothetical protein [Bosea sp. (in: a-proteobacteria)]|uniref:hypothetical protein n=1 Tax=Bosea sp. (in: a-proteobacteria) TaxID=1871050 RepID=UPI002637B061|nr:hypothetical protein [Bosea sp. (in: a-proteobacteria)]MCO5092190.1 hypothetical protein [Bosea sp. (in: a-proteobacteria)]